MSNDLVRQIDNLEIAAWESKKELIKRTVAMGATDDELALFFYQAKRSGLDPLARQIYYVKRKGKGTIQVGIDGLRLIADRTDNYAGNDDPEFIGTTDEGYPAKARVTVYKMVQGQRCPFVGVARWDEYYPGPDQGFQWRKMPHTMLGKCAEALALRKAFPADLSGLYVTEEMMQAGNYSGSVDSSTGEIQQPEVVEAQIVEETPKPERPHNDPPVGTMCFGHTPADWPGMSQFAADPSDKQIGMLAGSMDKIGITDDGDRRLAAELIAREYDVYAGDPITSTKQLSKGAVSLVIDWLIAAQKDADLVTNLRDAMNSSRGQDGLDLTDAEDPFANE